MAPGCRAYLAEAIKKVVDIPVIASGRLGDPALAEEVIKERKADLVAMGRPLLADPELPNKAAEERLGDIRFERKGLLGSSKIKDQNLENLGLWLVLRLRFLG